MRVQKIFLQRIFCRNEPPATTQKSRPPGGSTKKEMTLDCPSNDASRVISLHSWYLTSLVNLSFYGFNKCSNPNLFHSIHIFVWSHKRDLPGVWGLLIWISEHLPAWFLTFSLDHGAQKYLTLEEIFFLTSSRFFGKELESRTLKIFWSVDWCLKPGKFYLYIGITSCDYKISQLYAYFNTQYCTK